MESKYYPTSVFSPYSFIMALLAINHHSALCWNLNRKFRTNCLDSSGRNTQGDLHEKRVWLITSIEDHSPSMLEVAKFYFLVETPCISRLRNRVQRERSNMKSKVKLIANAGPVIPGLKPPNLQPHPPEPTCLAWRLSQDSLLCFVSIFFRRATSLTGGKRKCEQTATMRTQCPRILRT